MKCECVHVANDDQYKHTWTKVHVPSSSDSEPEDDASESDMVICGGSAHRFREARLRAQPSTAVGVAPATKIAKIAGDNARTERARAFDGLVYLRRRPRRATDVDGGYLRYRISSGEQNRR